MNETIWDSIEEEPASAIVSRPHVGRWLIESFLAERTRWFLWLPVILGCGASIYFVLTFEPDRSWVLWASCGLLCAYSLSLLLTRLLFVRLLFCILLVLSLGFALAQQRALWVAAPILQQAYGPSMIAGRVLDVEIAEAGPRIVMDHMVIPGLASDQTPVQIRIRLTRYSIPPRSGSVIRVRAVLMPPEGPAAPGAHDFRRDLFFERIGAVGYAMGKPFVLQPASETGGGAVMERMRQRIGQNIASALGVTPEAAIVTAYLTGERGLIDENTADDMRGSGLAHLLALSGMKVGLVAVLVFGASRMLLALLPAAATHVHSRKFAALAGSLAAGSYVAIAAAPVPALRSVLMTGTAMLAIMTNRQSTSLRIAALAACVLIVWQPESVVGVSFQMSFGAVIALISFYEAMQGRLSQAYRHAGRMRRTVLGVGKLLVTTLVATLVTAPLALFHFQQEANYSVIANAVAIPLNDIWIMPFGILAMLVMPLGLAWLPLQAMGIGVHWMLLLAHDVSRWPGAVTRVPALSDTALVLLELGGLWIILWKGKWRRLGWGVVALGCLAAAVPVAPDVLVSEDGKRVAFRMSDGQLAVSKIGARRDFTVDSWNRMNAARGLLLLPNNGTMDEGRIDCSASACTYRPHSGLPPVVMLRDPAAMGDVCTASSVIISNVRLQSSCTNALILDTVKLHATGAVALRNNGTAYDMETVAAQTGMRPWFPHINTDAASPPVPPESEPDPR